LQLFFAQAEMFVAAFVTAVWSIEVESCCSFASVAAFGTCPGVKWISLSAEAYLENAAASVSKSGLMSDGVLSANSLRIFARESKSLVPTPLSALLKAALRPASCLQFPAVAIDATLELLEDEEDAEEEDDDDELLVVAVAVAVVVWAALVLAAVVVAAACFLLPQPVVATTSASTAAASTSDLDLPFMTQLPSLESIRYRDLTTTSTTAPRPPPTWLRHGLS
jgi:hypothetical protein